MRKIFKKTSETFGALRDAEKWLEKNGFSYGPLCGKEPVACVRGDWSVAKWKNLSTTERNEADAIMMSDDWREGDVMVEIKGNEEENV